MPAIHDAHKYMEDNILLVFQPTWHYAYKPEFTNSPEVVSFYLTLATPLIDFLIPQIRAPKRETVIHH